MPSFYTQGIAPRVLYLPNEATFNDPQIGPRAAFVEMERDGTIRELKIYSFLAEFYGRNRNKKAEQQALLEIVRSFQPDILFWQHPSDYPVDRALLHAIRACGSAPLIVYHEADPYDRHYKKIHAEVAALYLESDVFFTVGLGGARRRFFAIRAHPQFHWTPSTFDLERVGLQPPDTSTIASDYDAIMIGTIAGRIRGLIKQPQAHKRVRLAQGLAKLFGPRFAAFGRGWPRSANPAGRLPYELQAATIQKSRMSVMWDLYPDYTFYFSDRLPIALASGVPFVTNARNGLDSIIPVNLPGFYQVDTIEDALDTALYLRSLPLDEIAAMGAAARTWAFKHLEARVVFRRAFDICLRVERP